MITFGSALAGGAILLVATVIQLYLQKVNLLISPVIWLGLCGILFLSGSIIAIIGIIESRNVKHGLIKNGPGLIIEARVIDNPNLSISERMSISLPIVTDTLKTIQIGLKINKPILINKLYLEIWGQRIESLEFPYLHQFVDNELIEHSDIFQTEFSIPKIYALNDPSATILIIANNNTYPSNSFPIKFGDSK